MQKTAYEMLMSDGVHTCALPIFLGGGRALVNSLYRHGEGLGVVAHYEAEVERVHLQDGACVGVTARLGGQALDFTARSVVFAAGGFQAIIPWLKESWGDAADRKSTRLNSSH